LAILFDGVGRSDAHLLVVSTNPPTTSRKAVLLSTNTEVSISPKMRGQHAGPSSAADKKQESNSGTPSASDRKNTESSLTTHTIRPIALRQLPMRVIDASSLPPPQDSYDSCMLYVSPTNFSRVFGGTRPTTDLTLYASIRVLPAPTIKDIPVTGGAGSTAASASTNASADPSMPVAKQLRLDGNSMQRGEEKNESGKAERVAFRALHGVPERHVVVIGQLPKSNIGEWDLIS
jgi:peroxin-1